MLINHCRLSISTGSMTSKKKLDRLSVQTVILTVNRSGRSRIMNYEASRTPVCTPKCHDKCRLRSPRDKQTVEIGLSTTGFG